MSRVIFDTNVYGFLLKEADQLELEKAILDDKDLVVYGFQPIRKELREVPKDKGSARKARILLLGLYDRIVKGRLLENSDRIILLAREYFKQYKFSRGSRSWGEIGVDFLVVACATVHNLDFVCSRDQEAFFYEDIQAMYIKVNFSKGLRTPTFFRYDDFLKELRKKIK